MYANRIFIAMLFAALAFASSACTAAAPQPISLREQLNQSYGPELVSYAFSAGKGECTADAIRVTGPSGPIAAQLTDIEYWPESKSVKSAKLTFVVAELKPLAALNYAVSYDKSAPVAASDLKITRSENAVEVATANVGAKFKLGHAKPASPVAFKDVPGMLTASRLGNQPAGGGSEFIGDAPVSEWTIALAESGPVLARVVQTCTFADGNVLSLTATVIAGDSAIRWDVSVKEDKPALSVAIRLPALPGVKQAVMPRGYGQWARNDKTAPVTPVARGGAPMAFLAPDSSVINIFADSPWSIVLAGDGGAQVNIKSRDTAAWVDPAAPYTYGGFTSWNLNMIPQSWENWKRKRIPITYETDGTITLQPNLAKGQRKWLVAHGVSCTGDRLDVVKDMVLDWPTDPKRPYPRVFVDNADIQAAWKRAQSDPALLKALQGAQPFTAGSALKVLTKPADQRTQAEVDAVIKSLRERLAFMNGFGLKPGEAVDAMRWAIAIVCQYDAVIDSGVLSPADKALFKAQMAHLGYMLDDARTWSIERGMHSGNPNMTISYELSLGVLACALSDHPMAKTWSDYASGLLDRMLSEEVGPNGEWLVEGSHYGHVSLEPMVAYAVAAKRAGFRDFTNDARLKKMLLYFAKLTTPQDVTRQNQRRSGAYGRGTSGDQFSVYGEAARMTAQSDPEFSKVMQWVYAASGYATGRNDYRLGGYEDYYADRTLPQAPPQWNTELFPRFAAVLRSAFNTPHESFAILISSTDAEKNLDIWTPEIGRISQWFGRGVPLSTCFNYKTGYNERHELFREGVRLARNWGQPGDPKIPFGYYVKTNFGTFAPLPRVDYVRTNFVHTRADDRDWFPDAVPAFPRVKAATEGKLDWTRQLLFMKDADPAGPAYLVLRDTTRGGQPTAWQFWTLSEKLGTPEQAKTLDAFLADKPGPTLQPARELPGGARYTAIGQNGVDVEYFIASPTDTPRHTLRAGGPDNSRVPEYEDALLLQQPGDGTYFVVLYPRLRAEAAPGFSTHADGKVIKVESPVGIDYAFLAENESDASVDGVSFKGTAGSLQQRGNDSIISLGAAGVVKWKDWSLTGATAASIHVSGNTFTLTIPASGAGGKVQITAPGNWKHADANGVKIDFKSGVFDVSTGPTQNAATVVFTKK